MAIFCFFTTELSTSSSPALTTKSKFTAKGISAGCVPSVQPSERLSGKLSKACRFNVAVASNRCTLCTCCTAAGAVTMAWYTARSPAESGNCFRNSWSTFGECSMPSSCAHAPSPNCQKPGSERRKVSISVSHCTQPAIGRGAAVPLTSSSGCSASSVPGAKGWKPLADSVNASGSPTAAGIVYVHSYFG